MSIDPQDRHQNKFHRVDTSSSGSRSTRRMRLESTECRMLHARVVLTQIGKNCNIARTYKQFACVILRSSWRQGQKLMHRKRQRSSQPRISGTLSWKLRMRVLLVGRLEEDKTIVNVSKPPWDDLCKGNGTTVEEEHLIDYAVGARSVADALSE